MQNKIGKCLLKGLMLAFINEITSESLPELYGPNYWLNIILIIYNMKNKKALHFQRRLQASIKPIKY